MQLQKISMKIMFELIDIIKQLKNYTNQTHKKPRVCEHTHAVWTKQCIPWSYIQVSVPTNVHTSGFNNKI